MNTRHHPTVAELQVWLTSTGAGPIGDHVDGCEDCQSTLEEISGLDDELVADLASVLSVPAGIEARTVSAVEQRLRDEEALGVFVDLFGLGWSTLRTILDPRGDNDG